VEQEDPARTGEHTRGQRRRAPGEPVPEDRDRRDAEGGEQRGEEPHRVQSTARMRDRPREQEVQRSAAALAQDDVDDGAEAVTSHEERERLVLVRRPG
jgi:hypothetical protein